MQDEYWRKARLRSVVDGDTIRLVIDMGFRATREESIRLLDVDSPEIFRGLPEQRELGRAAKEFVIGWFEQHGRMGCGENKKWPFALRTQKSDSFGRYLGHIECLKGHILNDILIESGHAKKFEKRSDLYGRRSNLTSGGNNDNVSNADNESK